jgi:hypothetical protein
MRNFKIEAKQYQVKTNFAECTLDEISHCMVAANIIAERKNLQAKLSILFRLITPKLTLKEFEKLAIQQKISLLNLVRWAWEKRIEAKPFKSFTIDGEEFFLPDPNFSNTSAIEFALCNMYYLAFTHKTHPKKDLVYNIVAILCRPERADLSSFRLQIERWTGDRREPFNSNLADERATLFKNHAPHGVIIAILQYFEAMNNFMFNRFQEIFKASDAKPLFNNGEGWLAMLEDVAETNIMGDLDKVHATNAFSVMLHISHKQAKIKRIEEMQEKEQ